MKLPRLLIVSFIAVFLVISGTAPNAHAQDTGGDSCANAICPTGNTCYQGACFPKIEEADACAGVTCPAGNLCHEGACFPELKASTEADACAVACAGISCPAEQVCHMGTCFLPVSESRATDICSKVQCPAGHTCYQGVCFPPEPAEQYQSPDLCRDVTCPSGHICHEGACFIEEEALVAPAGGRPNRTNTAGGLEILPLPEGARQARYLSLDEVTISRDQTISISYRGLPAKDGSLVLFFIGGTTPKRVAWAYTLAKKPDGLFERRANTMPAYTGPWKACLGFDPSLRQETAKPEDFDDCVDFHLAGSGSLGVKPEISLPAEGVVVGRDFELNWSGFPPTASRLVLVRQGSDVAVAHRATASQTTGTWKARVGAPGPYELRIYFEGDDLRARMSIEVTR